MILKDTKEVWDKLEIIYEGDNKVNQKNLQILKENFESL
jgi:hypothetical protein